MFSRIKTLLLLLSRCFSLLRLANFFRLSKAFLQYFLFVNLTMVFFYLEVFLGFLNMWLASDVSESTSTSISLSIDATVASNTLSVAHFGIPKRTILFLLPYWSRLFKFSPKLVTLSSNDLHLLCKQAFSSCSLLITMSFELRSLSLRTYTGVMWLTIVPSSFILVKESSSFETLPYFFFLVL